MHYRSDPQRRTRLFAAIEVGAIPASVAIDDFAAVLYEDGALVRVLRWRDGASAYGVSLQGTHAVEVPYAPVPILPARA